MKVRIYSYHGRKDAHFLKAEVASTLRSEGIIESLESLWR